VKAVDRFPIENPLLGKGVGDAELPTVGEFEGDVILKGAVDGERLALAGTVEGERLILEGTVEGERLALAGTVEGERVVVVPF